jgi:ABC-type antimicrobial peptide transport system permease subunit
MNLKLSSRIVFRNKTYSRLNIAGLAVGIAAAIIILLWIENEWAFDRHFPRSKQLYLVGNTSFNRTYMTVSHPFREMLATDFPEIANQSAYRSTDADVELFYKDGDPVGYPAQGASADASLFDLLDIELTAGDRASLFAPALPIVISEAMAQRIFGDARPVGQTLRRNGGRDVYEITGVFRPLPKNSSFRFDWLIPFDLHVKKTAEQGWDPRDDWHTSYFACCVEVPRGVDIDALNRKINDAAAHRSGNERLGDFFLYPLTQMHLYGEFDNGQPVAGHRVRFIRTFALLALIVLMVACINYTNLSTARSEKRALEVGLRKTFGARRRQLIGQFMGESAAITAVALVAAVVLVVAVLPYFNQLLDVDLSVHLRHPRHVLGLLAIGAVCSLLAGLYPSFYLASLNPNDNLKRLKNRYQRSGVPVRTLLVVFQFAVSFILIVLSSVIFLQIRHGQQRPLGYRHEGLLSVSRLPDGMRERYEIIRDELLKTGLVRATGLTNLSIMRLGSTTGSLQWQGKDPDFKPAVNQLFVSPGFIETVGLTLLEGRDFYAADSLDRRSVLVNKTLAGMMGEAGHVNGAFEFGGGIRATIVGIVDDFVFGDIYKVQHEPVFFHKDTPGTLVVRYDLSAGEADVLQAVQTVINRFEPDVPIQYTFMDDEFRQLFRSQRQEATLAAWFGLLAVFISCMGLLGLSAFSTERRTKEIGIRKIMGARVRQIVVLLVRNFIVQVAAGFAVGLPVAWYLAAAYLRDYAYRITLHWALFAGAAALLLLAALLTVALQSFRAATANPVKAIQAE